ncbi:MAG TPA: thioredoxin TrxC [Burkholderiaceae bacterium]|nr:thioredoxin TrxC [Burkholderiaceae bacterium]
MDTDTDTDRVHVVCAHCDTVNRVVAERSRDAVCGDCGNALFASHPHALRAASLERHIARSDVPVLVDFWASWCAPCRVMAPVFEQAARELEPAYRLIKVNTDEEPEAAQHHRIRGIPTFAIFRNGTEAARISGAMDARSFIAWVRANS